MKTPNRANAPAPGRATCATTDLTLRQQQPATPAATSPLTDSASRGRRAKRAAARTDIMSASPFVAHPSDALQPGRALNSPFKGGASGPGSSNGTPRPAPPQPLAD